MKQLNYFLLCAMFTVVQDFKHIVKYEAKSQIGLEDRGFADEKVIFYI